MVSETWSGSLSDVVLCVMVWRGAGMCGEV